MDYTELKRLAEDAIDDSRCRHDFQMEVTPKVVLGLIRSLEHTTMAAESEAKEVDERNAVIDRLCTQNQALVEALELAMDNLRPHGDNCFLRDEGEYNSCFCGKDGLANHFQDLVEKSFVAQAEGGV